MTTTAEASPAASHCKTFRGVHHLVLTTEDMKMTIDFYTNVLGMPLVHALKTPAGVAVGPKNRGNPPFECIRHYFFDMGHDSLLAFFEMPKGAKKQADRDAIGGMQHVSFMVADATHFEALQQRLKAQGVATQGPLKMASSPGFSLYFYDPNGVRLEASCDPTKNRPTVLRDATQGRRQVVDELRSLCDDEEWLESVTAHLAE